MALYPAVVTRDVASETTKVRTNVDGSKVYVKTVTYASGSPATETIEIPITKVS